MPPETRSKPSSFKAAASALAFSMIFPITSDGERLANISYLALYAINGIILVKSVYGIVLSRFKKESVLVNLKKGD